MTHHNKLSADTCKRETIELQTSMAFINYYPSIIHAVWSLMPLLGIAIKCEVFMVTGLPSRKSLNSIREWACVNIHTVWSLYPGANTPPVTSPEYIHTQTKSIGQLFVQCMHNTHTLMFNMNIQHSCTIKSLSTECL